MSPATDRRAVRLLTALGWAALALAAAPALAPWLVAGHSAVLDLERAEALHRAIVGGAWLPRWLPALYGGYGSPIFNYYSPLAYFVGEALRLAGAGPLWAPKLVLALSLLVGALGARAVARRLFGEAAGAAAFGLWPLAPYLLLDVYVRSATGEIAGLALLPVALASVLALGERATAGAVARAALAVALLVLAHNVVALLAVPVLAVVAAGTGDRRARLRGLAAIAGGLALSALFWLPALAERDLVWAEESLTGGAFDYRANFLPAGALWPWRAQMQFPGHYGEPFGFRFGFAFGLGLAALPWLARRLPESRRRAALAVAGAFVLALLLATSASLPVWRLFPLLRFVQFPYRLLGPASLAGVLLLSAAVAASRGRARVVIGAALLVLVGIDAGRELRLARYGLVDRQTLDLRIFERGEIGRAELDPRLVDPFDFVCFALDRRSDFSGTVGEDFLPRTVARRPAPMSGSGCILPGVEPGALSVVAERCGSGRIAAELEVRAATTLLVHQFAFPGWRATVDGRARAIAPEPVGGRIAIEMRPGDRRLELVFGDTPERRAAELASGTAAAGLALYVLLARRRQRAPAAPEPRC